MTGTGGMAKHSECCAIGGDLNLLIQMKHVYQDWNEKCAAELGLKMCTRTGIKDAYHSWD
jgi:hypothetical protein